MWKIIILNTEWAMCYISIERAGVVTNYKSAFYSLETNRLTFSWFEMTLSEEDLIIKDSPYWIPGSTRYKRKERLANLKNNG